MLAVARMCICVAMFFATAACGITIAESMDGADGISYVCGIVGFCSASVCTHAVFVLANMAPALASIALCALLVRDCCIDGGTRPSDVADTQREKAD
jgi:hypothetical protein